MREIVEHSAVAEASYMLPDELSQLGIFEAAQAHETIEVFDVRHPRQRRWLDERGRLKGDRPNRTADVI